MQSAGSGLGSARNIDETVLAAVLRGLAPVLSADLLDRALSVAGSIREGEAWLKALCGLGSYLPERAKLAVAHELLGAASRMNDEHDRFDEDYCAGLLAEIAPWLPAAAMPEAAAIAMGLSYEDGLYDGLYSRIDAVVGLFPFLPDHLKTPVVDSIGATSAQHSAVDGLREVTPHLPPELAQRVQEAILGRGNQRFYAGYLARLARRLPDEHRASGIDVALSAILKIRDGEARAYLLADLAPNLPTELKSTLLSEALADIRKIADPYNRVLALCKLVPHLPDGPREEVLQEVTTTARKVRPVWARQMLYLEVFPVLSGERKEEVADEVFALMMERADRTQSFYLSRIAEHLPAPLQADAIAVIGGDDDEALGVKLLSEIAPCLAEPAQKEALAAVDRVAHAALRADALSAFAIHFSGAHKATAVHSLATLLADMAGTAPPAGPSQPEIDAAVAGALEALSEATG